MAMTADRWAARRAVVRLTAALTVLGLAGATAAAAPAAAATTPRRAAPDDRAGPAPAVHWDGTWQADGYGRVLTVRGGVLTTYDLTSAGCLPGLLTARSAGPPDRSGALHLLVDGRAGRTHPAGRPGPAPGGAAPVTPRGGGARPRAPKPPRGGARGPRFRTPRHG
ncbi:hypothetical protein ACFV0G_26410, partial [Kitasatospora sp. NPDC059571]